MKKLIAIVCAFVLMSIMLVSANAAGSPGSVIGVVVVDPVIATLEVEGETYTAMLDSEAEVEDDWNNAVVALVRATNDPQDKTTFEEKMDALADALDDVDVADGILTVTNPDGTTVSVDLSTADFVSGFSELSLTNTSGEESFDIDGSAVSATIPLVYEQLQGVDLSQYKLLLVNPITGQIALIQLTPEMYDAETGAINVTLPFLGVFALIKG